MCKLCIAQVHLSIKLRCIILLFGHKPKIFHLAWSLPIVRFMRPDCINDNCRSNHIIKDGFFYRTSDRKKLQRWKCNKCHKRFSAGSNSKAFGQNKRWANSIVRNLICSGVSLRRAALILGVHRITVARKLCFLAEIAEEEIRKDLFVYPKVNRVQFDELFTIEHTKCKPLSVAMAVEEGTRKIMGFEVSIVPASGHLAVISRKKYGHRPNYKRRGIKRVLGKIQDTLSAESILSTDEDSHYASLIKKLPGVTHISHKGAKGCVAGQGELKKLVYDPLFYINHTFAMLRANINRLFRRTWCTTKKISRLEKHLWVYMHFHNTVLIAK